MKSCDGYAAEHGLAIVLELANARDPVSLEDLEARTILSRGQLDAGLRLLESGSVVRRDEEAKPCYRLAEAPDRLPVGRVCEALANGGGASTGAPTLAGVDPRTTLAELRDAIAVADSEVCPYYDACIALGGPQGPFIKSCCREPAADACAPGPS